MNLRTFLTGALIAVGAGASLSAWQQQDAMAFVRVFQVQNLPATGIVAVAGGIFAHLAKPAVAVVAKVVT